MTGGPQLRAESMLVYYFRAGWLAAGKGWDSAKEAEVRSVVADILAAAAAELAQVRHNASRDLAAAQSFAAALDMRVLALEEIVATQWPHRGRVRARLGRQLRVSWLGLQSGPDHTSP